MESKESGLGSLGIMDLPTCVGSSRTLSLSIFDFFYFVVLAALSKRAETQLAKPNTK